MDELYSCDWRVLSLVFLFFFFNTEVVFLSLLRPTFPSCTFFSATAPLTHLVAVANGRSLKSFTHPLINGNFIPRDLN